MPTYLPVFFRRVRRQRRSFLSTFKVCRIANALAHDNLIRRIKLFLTDGKKIRSVVNSNPFSEFPFAPGIFQWDEPKKNVYHLFPNRNFREFVVNGKQPIIILMTIMLHFNLVPKLLSGYSSSPGQRLVGRTVGKTLIEFLYTTHTSLRIHMFPYG